MGMIFAELMQKLRWVFAYVEHRVLGVQRNLFEG